MSKPIIGIVARPLIRNNEVRISGVSEALRNYVIYGGGIPVLILPPQNIVYIDSLGSEIPSLIESEKNDLIEVINKCNGIILQGGNRCYEFDHFIASYLIKNDIPTLGLCMGMQLLVNTDNNTFYGRSNELNNSNINHDNRNDKYAHRVRLVPGTFLSNIIHSSEFEVSSMHKYHITHVTNFLVNAYSDDDLIEGVEYPNKKFMIGLQWHPEKTFNDDLESKEIIKKFINVCKD